MSVGYVLRTPCHGPLPHLWRKWQDCSDEHPLVLASQLCGGRASTKVLDSRRSLFWCVILLIYRTIEPSHSLSWISKILARSNLLVWTGVTTLHAKPDLSVLSQTWIGPILKLIPYTLKLHHHDTFKSHWFPAQKKKLLEKCFYYYYPSFYAT